MLLGLFAILKWAPDIAMARCLSRWLVEKPADRWSGIRRGQWIGGILLIVLVGVLIYAEAGDALHLLTMASPEIAMLFSTFEMSLYADLIMTGFVAWSARPGWAVRGWVGAALRLRPSPSRKRARRRRTRRTGRKAANDDGPFGLAHRRLTLPACRPARRDVASAPMKTLLLSTAAAAAILVAAAPSPASARAMTEVDLNAMKRLGAPVVSPDGSVAVYQVTSTDIDANSRSTQLYSLDLTVAEAVPVLIVDMPDASESSPAFGADGSLYFLSDKSGSDQLWRVRLPDGKPYQVSDFGIGVAGFKLAPDGKRVALWSAIPRDCASFGCPAPEPRADEAKRSGREYDEYFVRHWTSWVTPGTFNRIFAFDLVNGKIAGDGHALDRGVTGNAPTDPFGGGEELNWSADGSTLFYTLRQSGQMEPRSTNTDVYAAAADGSSLTNLTEANQATDTMPTPSPDGKYLAYAAMARPGYESDRLVLMLRDLAAGTTQALTQRWDRSIGSIAWAPDSSHMIVTAADTLDTPAFMVALDGTVSRLTQRGSIGDTIPLADGSMLYTKNSIQAPNDLFRMLPGGNERQLTAVNAELFAQIDPVQVERFSFKGANGDTVWGQVIKPDGAPKGNPTAYLVHGGPQGSFGDGWSFRWNPKMFASHGYTAVTVDFHGSTGYGQAFTDAINRDWGGKPLTDLKLGLAAAAKFDGAVTPDNACALGASYGGYMMNWFMGQWPGQFKCIVNHAGLFDMRAFYYSTEELWFPEWDFGGPYYEARETYEKWNPVNYVHQLEDAGDVHPWRKGLPHPLHPVVDGLHRRAAAGDTVEAGGLPGGKPLDQQAAEQHPVAPRRVCLAGQVDRAGKRGGGSDCQIGFVIARSRRRRGNPGRVQRCGRLWIASPSARNDVKDLRSIPVAIAQPRCHGWQP